MFTASNLKVVPGKSLALWKLFKFPIILIMPFIAKEKNLLEELNPE